MIIIALFQVVPGFGPSLYGFLEEMIKKQKAKLQTGQSSEEGGNPIGKIFEYFVFGKNFDNLKFKLINLFF